MLEGTKFAIFILFGVWEGEGRLIDDFHVKYIPLSLGETENKGKPEIGDERDRNVKSTENAHENSNALVKGMPGLANHTTGLYKEIRVNSMVKAKRWDHFMSRFV